MGRKEGTDDDSSAVEYFKALLQEVSQFEAEGDGTLPSVSTETSPSSKDLDTGPDLWDLTEDWQTLLNHSSADHGSSSLDLFNASGLDSLRKFVGTFKQNLDVTNPISDRVFWTLCIIYLVLIIIGFFGNVLILWAVLGRESMRTARNVFIVTLAISDLVLCLFTMPSTLWEVRIFAILENSSCVVFI